MILILTGSDDKLSLFAKMQRLWLKRNKVSVVSSSLSVDKVLSVEGSDEAIEALEATIEQLKADNTEAIQAKDNLLTEAQGNLEAEAGKLKAAEDKASELAGNLEAEAGKLKAAEDKASELAGNLEAEAGKLKAANAKIKQLESKKAQK